ncbi:MAG: hypothetical protein P8M25_03300 [Paracoccaceae bacterium]|nr:hypothetical protein [Paracoccaceae bacterium]
MSRAEQIEAYVMPSGVTMQLLRETAAKRPRKTRLIHKLDQHKVSKLPFNLGETDRWYQSRPCEWTDDTTMATEFLNA